MRHVRRNYCWNAGVTYVAERMRAIYRDPTPLAMEELLALSLSVEQMETTLDDIAAQAVEDEQVIRRFRAKVARQAAS